LKEKFDLTMSQKTIDDIYDKC